MKKSELYKTAKLFYEDGRRFAICGDIIRFSGKREDDSQYLFSPLIYIERHTIELLLKSLVLCSADTNEQFRTIKDIKINPSKGGQCRGLMESHSLLDLVNCYEGLEKLKLIPNYTEDEIEFVRKILQEYDAVDKSSTFFRYPIDKTQNTTKTNSRSLLRAIDDAHPVSSIKDGTYILQDKERVMYTVKDKKIVKMEYDLTKVIIILFKLNPFFS